MSYRAEIAEMLRNMPPDWRRQYRTGRDTLARNGGPVLPDVPTPEQAMLIIANTAGGNPDTDTPHGDQPVPKAVRDAAMKGLRLSHRNNYGGWEFFGIARAIQLALVPAVPMRTRQRMVRYLSDHEKDKAGTNFGNDAKPSRGYMAWLNWGGDPAVAWNRKDGIDRASYGTAAKRRNGAATSVATKVGAKVGLKGAAKLVPVVGEAIMAYDVAQEGRKLYRERKGGKKHSLRETGARLAGSAFVGSEGVAWAQKKLEARKRNGRIVSPPAAWTEAVTEAILSTPRNTKVPALSRVRLRYADMPESLRRVTTPMGANKTHFDVAVVAYPGEYIPSGLSTAAGIRTYGKSMPHHLKGRMPNFRPPGLTITVARDVFPDVVEDTVQHELVHVMQDLVREKTEGKGLASRKTPDTLAWGNEAAEDKEFEAYLVTFRRRFERDLEARYRRMVYEAKDAENIGARRDLANRRKIEQRVFEDTMSTMPIQKADLPALYAVFRRKAAQGAAVVIERMEAEFEPEKVLRETAHLPKTPAEVREWLQARFAARKNPLDLRGRFIPPRYLAGLSASEKKQRIAELTASRDAYGTGDFSELPSDRLARKKGLVKMSPYSQEARARGIEWRGSTDEMAERVLSYYGVRSGKRELSEALRQSYARGLAAWKSGGHRPGATARNWADARVHSFVTGGKTTWTGDADLFRSLPNNLRAAIEAQRVAGTTNPRRRNPSEGVVRSVRQAVDAFFREALRVLGEPDAEEAARLRAARDLLVDSISRLIADEEARSESRNRSERERLERSTVGRTLEDERSRLLLQRSVDYQLAGALDNVRGVADGYAASVRNAARNSGIDAFWERLDGSLNTARLVAEAVEEEKAKIGAPSDAGVLLPYDRELAAVRGRHRKSLG